MATLNEDTTAAAFQILEQPDFKVFIPQHLLMLGQNYILIYICCCRHIYAVADQSGVLATARSKSSPD